MIIRPRNAPGCEPRANGSLLPRLFVVNEVVPRYAGR